jgi:hypothetical protein
MNHKYNLLLSQKKFESKAFPQCTKQEFYHGHVWNLQIFYCLFYTTSETAWPPILGRGGARLGPGLGTVPGTLDEAVPVDKGEEVLLEVVKGPPGLLLTAKDAGKGLLGDAAVLELAQHELVVAGEQGAAGVAVVGGAAFPAGQRGGKVLYQHGGLRRNGRGRLAVGQAGGVADGEDVGELGVARRGLVDVDPAGGVGQRRLGHKVPRLLRGDDVQELVVAADLGAVGGQVLERGHLLAGVDAHQVVLEEALDAAVDAQLLQRGRVLGHGEHGGGARGEGRADGGADAVLLPLAQRHPQDLLRGAGALDDACGLGEDGLALLKILDVAPHLLDRLVRVDGRDAAGGVLEGILEARDAGKVSLEAGGHHEVVIGEVDALGGLDGIVLGVKAGDTQRVVLGSRRDDSVHGLGHAREGLEARSDQSPTRLRKKGGSD